MSPTDKIIFVFSTGSYMPGCKRGEKRKLDYLKIMVWWEFFMKRYGLAINEAEWDLQRFYKGLRKG